jgi:hypothetical protein
MAMSAPQKPMAMAIPRRQPIHSPSSGPASNATVSGARKLMGRLVEAQVAAPGS